LFQRSTTLPFDRAVCAAAADVRSRDTSFRCPKSNHNFSSGAICLPPGVAILVISTPDRPRRTAIVEATGTGNDCDAASRTRGNLYFLMDEIKLAVSAVTIAGGMTVCVNRCSGCSSREGISLLTGRRSSMSMPFAQSGTAPDPRNECVVRPTNHNLFSLSVQQNPSVRHELIRKIEVPDVTGHHGPSKLAPLQIEQCIVQTITFGARAVLAQTQQDPSQNSGRSPHLGIRGALRR
jgi:hypothetical protein